MNKRFWHSTKLFKDFDRGIQDDLVNTYLAYDISEKRKRAELRRSIPLHMNKGEIIQSYYDEKFFKESLSFDEFKNICNDLAGLRVDIMENKVELKALSKSKRTVKYSFTLVVIALIIFFVALQEWFSFSKELYLAGLGLSIMGVVASFICSVIAVIDIPKLDKCINPAFTRLSEYISELNDKMKARLLRFQFDVQLMQVDVSKL